MRAMSTAVAEEHPIDPERSGGTAGASAPPSVVLLAEDDHAMRELLASVFTADGYEVVEARDGSELIGHLADLARTPHGREALAASRWPPSSPTCACHGLTASTCSRPSGARTGTRP